MSCTASSHHHGRAPPSPVPPSHSGLYPLKSQGKVNNVNLGNCLCQVFFISHELNQCTVKGCYIVLPGEYGEEERNSVCLLCNVHVDTIIKYMLTMYMFVFTVCMFTMCMFMFTVYMLIVLMFTVTCSPCACSCSLCTCSPCTYSCSPCMCSPCTCSLWTCSR